MKKKFTSMLSKVLKSFLVVCIPSMVFINNLNAQNNKNALTLQKDVRVEKFIMSKDLNTPSLIRIKDGNKVLVKDVVVTLKQLLQADANTNFVTASSTQNNGGIVVNKYQQFYKNIKVQHGVYTAIATADKVEAFTGEYYDLKNINIQPTITEKQALEFAKKYVNAKSYAWEQAKEARDVTTDLLRKQLLNAAYEKLLPVGEIVIVKDVDGNGVDLSYKFDIYAGAPMSRAYVYVNAHTGKIMLYDRIIKHLSPDQKNISEHNGIVPEVAFILSGAADLSNAPTAIGDTATVGILTRYAGMRLMGTTNVSGTANDPSGSGVRIVNSINGTPFVAGENPWTLNDKRFHGVNSSQSEQTYSLNGIGGLPISVPVYNVARSFTDVDNNWTSAEHKRSGATGNNEGNNDDFAFDAHWGAGVVKQYWKNIHGRASYDNQNSSIKSYIHSGQEYDNAFWNGSVMTYGDGSYQNGIRGGFAPLTSLDVCGHEIGHGVCSNTANLVYAGESGAMNEGYSDVWAAMIENYALTNIDPSLIASSTNNNGLSVWEIGEQIDARDTIAGGTRPNLKNYGTNDPLHTALRYMGDPNRAGDPAFYAEGPTTRGTTTTRKWKNPNCTGGPTLANDQCGVHSNSGVLNKLVYNLVLGNIGITNTVDSENLSGNGAAYAVKNGEPFSVTGIGFDKTQRIMYLAELTLSPNAKFVDERNAAVLAAEILFGKCSFEWKQTIVAFHSVAIGKSSDTSLCATLPKFTVALSKNVVSEYAPKSAINCTDSWTNVTLAYSMLSPGNLLPVTVTITPTGTAEINKDYTIAPSITTTYAANETGLKTSTISVYNDAEIESTETIVLAIHATDGLLFTKDTTVTISIIDDDNAPIIGNGRVNLMNQNFDGVIGNGLPTGWSVIDKLGANKSTITWITGTLAAQYGFPTTAAYVTLKATPPATSAPNYDQAMPGEILLSTSLIDATGKTDLKLNFTWAAQGEPSGSSTTSTQDFGTVVYSLDGINFMPFQFAGKEYNFTPKATSDSFFLPSILNNKKFYLGFNWKADANVAALPPFIIDSVVVSGGTQQIEKTATYSVSETQYANKDLYYLSAQNAQVIAHVSNNSADLGCVTATISEAGNGTAANISFNGSTYLRAKRVVQITPSLLSTGKTYNLTLYATTAELAGLTPSSLHILKVKDGTTTTGTILPANAIELTPAFGDSSKSGYFTYTVNNVSGFSQFVLAVKSSVLSQQLLSFNAMPQNNKFIKISWTTSNEGTGTHTLERAIKGSTDFKFIDMQPMLNASGLNQYFYDDKNVVENVVYQYRLKSQDNNSFKYSAIKQASITGKNAYLDISPNPSTGIFKVAVNGLNEMSEMTVFNAAGQEVYKNKQMLNNNSVVSIDLTKQPAGIYTLKVNMQDRTEVYKLIVQ